MNKGCQFLTWNWVSNLVAVVGFIPHLRRDHYDSTIPITLWVDASEDAIGGTLLQNN